MLKDTVKPFKSIYHHLSNKIKPLVHSICNVSNGFNCPNAQPRINSQANLTLNKNLKKVKKNNYDDKCMNRHHNTNLYAFFQSNIVPQNQENRVHAKRKFDFDLRIQYTSCW